MLVADRVGAHGRHVDRGPVTDTAAGTIAIGVFEAERARVAAALVRRRAAELATDELPDGARDEW
jgi:hypothetical protein